MRVKCGGKVVYDDLDVQSRWSGEIEESRKSFVERSSKWLTAAMGIIYAERFTASVAHAAEIAEGGADKIRAGFMQVVDVFTAIAEPILWFYAVTACIMMATGKSKEAGWDRLKRVGYAYIFISLLPTFFMFMRWIAGIIKGSIQF